MSPRKYHQKNVSVYLNYTSYFINSTIESLSDENFDIIITYQDYNNKLFDYLILFSFKRCQNCNQIM